MFFPYLLTLHFLDSEPNEFRNIEPNIILRPNIENYDTYVITQDVIECKGILSITNAYKDTLKQGRSCL